MAGSPWDNPRGLFTDVPVVTNEAVSIGDASKRLLAVYAKNVYADNLVGDTTLPNNTALLSVNAARTGTNSLIKSDTFDKTVLITPTGSQFAFQYGGAINGYISATGSVFPVSVNSPIFNLMDNADKNVSVNSSASGTAYNLTATPAQLVFGTSNAQIVLPNAGTYMIFAQVNYEFNGATFAANRNVITTLRRTNNTPADITGSSTTMGTNIVTTVSGVFAKFTIFGLPYVTTNTNDIITIFGSVSVVPTAGNLQATEANIVAFRLYT